ncbi:hypothetical protein EWM64_g6556 [Hericium alpestre]|uniref:Uncharacterized protein n=1 Tax=Hericium alpestre TaxID=135208 RepID=A0A4Y9ZRE8_9AGAM|nr:hypothetical protein EWM64_g6556 [Hericium alpestre]
MASMAAMTMKTALAHSFRPLSPERGHVEGDLDRGMREAARQARGPQSILQRLLTLQTDQNGGRLGLTREEVLNTVASVLGTASMAAYDILRFGIQLLEFTPIPGLASVGQVLLNIWAAVEQVETNQHACERLAEHCAVIVSFVREQVCNTHGFVADDLKPSVAKLDKALQEVETFVKEQALQSRTQAVLNRRMLKRRVAEIQARLTQAFQFFNYTVPLHILHFLQREIHPGTEHQDSVEVVEPAAVITMHSSRELQPQPHATAGKGHPIVLEVTRKPHTADIAGPTIVQIDVKQAQPNVPSIAKPPQNTPNRQLDIPRKYAGLLQHEFDESLSLPLWTPTPVSIGTVGYFSKANGRFVALFDAHSPSGRVEGIPALSEYGPVDAYRPKPTASTGGSRTYSLKGGVPAACLYTETTMYRCFKDMQGPERWLFDHADQIIDVYGVQHPIDRKKLLLVTATMTASDYAMFMFPIPPNGEITFSRRKAKPGQPWGAWSQTSATEGVEPTASKVSTVKSAHEKWDTVLLSVVSYHRVAASGAQ